jgi:hypothetical protein
MTRHAWRLVVGVVWLGLVPVTVDAQGLATIAGMVRDSSGAVLPGVSVEAASPALIEKIRTAVTDGSGQYRIIELRPGTYTVTFALPGFNTVRREGIELTGSATATVSVELRVGALEETVTVTGEAPTVDVQSTTRQRVIDSQMMDALPSGRNQFNLGVLIPGVTVSTGGLSAQDVGGARGPETTALAVHGSRTADQRVTQNGVPLSSMVGGGWGSGSITNPIATQEITVDTAAVSADMATGGVRINLIPREGGNTFRGVVFASGSAEGWQSSNYSDDLRQRGLSTPGRIEKNWDFTPGFGGPILRDRLWFFTAFRHQGANNYVAGMFYNRNANDPTKWTFEPDESRPAIIPGRWRGAQGRFTWQAMPKHKIGLTWDDQDFCKCPDAINAVTAPEAGYDRDFPVERTVQADWTSPINSRLLLEVSGVQKFDRWGNMHLHEKDTIRPEMISVTEQGGSIPGLTYRARATYNNSYNSTFHYRGALSYITGSHAVKVGFNDAFGEDYSRTYDNQPIAYRFNNGVPNQLTLRSTPYTRGVDVHHDLGVFAQDKWTTGRWTISAGIRYDYFSSGFPEQTLGPTPLLPTRDISYPELDNLSYHNITPKTGVAYDVFGTGKTAVKVSLNKYLAGYGTSGLASDPNPILNQVTSATRVWTDADRDYVPDCNLLDPNANGECQRLSDANFGTVRQGSAYAADITRGWDARDFNWEFSTGVQHEVLPRLSVDVSYFRRWYGNFRVTDNRTVDPADFDPFSVTVAADPRLPEGGGYTISGLYDLNPRKFGLAADNLVTLAKNYGKQVERFDGIDVSLASRMRAGLMAQGGVSFGKTTTDNCEITAQVDNPSPLYCRVETPFQPNIKALAAYVVPRIDVQVSGTFQSLPGAQLSANLVVPNAAVRPSLGRDLSGGVNTTVNIIAPGTLYGERLNQLDIRVGKILRLGPRRLAVNLDVYNALNAATVLTYNNQYAALFRPQSILQARFAKISAQLDF